MNNAIEHAAPANLLGDSPLWHPQEQVLQLRVDVPTLATNFVNAP